MRASQLDDPLYESDDLDLDAPEPMTPIRLQHVTHETERKLLIDTCERLGLIFTFVGQNMFALSECESNSVRLTATEQLMREGIAEPTAERVTERGSGLLRQLVIENARQVGRSALHAVSPEVERFAREQRALADVELAVRGVDMKARIAHAIAESEAA